MSGVEALNQVKERAYIDGRNAALRQLMLHCGRELGALSDDDTDKALAKMAYLLDERARAVKGLREVCARLGCNDWPDGLDLGDVVEKHLARALDASEETMGT